MSLSARWRFDPFGGGYQPILISAESHVIEYVPEIAKYGIFLNEAPQFDSPSTVVITGYTEVSRLTSPTGTQFRVDYLADTYYSTGFIEFHSSKNGLTVSIDYYGLGTIIHPNFRALTNYNFAGTVNVEQQFSAALVTDSSSTITGGAIFSGGVGIAKKLYVGTDVNIGANLIVTGDYSNVLKSTDTTDASSTITGGAIFSGGVGIAKKLYVGTDVNIGANLIGAGTTDASSSITGAFKTAGGMGIAKKLYVGTDANIGGVLNVTSDITTAQGLKGERLILNSNYAMGSAMNGASIRSQRYDINMPVGNTAIVTAHGLGNIATGSRFWGMLWAMYNPATGVYYTNSLATNALVGTYAAIDNTNISIFRGTTGVAMVVTVTVFYTI